MRHSFITFACSLLLAAACNAQTSDSTTQENLRAEAKTDEIEEVLIIGEQPGPSLWKVYKDNHVLWVLGTLSPLPKKMQWRSQQAENALRNSQELLLPPNTKLDAGFFSIAAMIPSLIGIQKNPAGSSLQELLPAETYTQWLGLKEKYIGKDTGVEKYRPLFAGSELIDKSIEKSGLLAEDVAWAKVEKIAKKEKITINRPTILFKLDSPRATVKKFKKSSMDDIPCFTQILSRIEPDLTDMRARANAWAIGDVETLSKLPVANYDATCFAAAMSSSISEEKDIKEMPEKLEALWLTSAAEVLAKNQTTFAILPIGEILKRDGYIAKLRDKGYRIEGFGFEAPQEQSSNPP
jgi:hypothetical protein